MGDREGGATYRLTGPPSAPPVSTRPAVAGDRAALLRFIELDVGGTSYYGIPRYFLQLALEGHATESRAVVAERDGEILGFTMFGDVAGAIGAGRLHFISVSASARLQAIGATLCEAAVRDLAAHGTRLVVAEVPADPAVANGLTLLARCGFTESSRVPDYYRDGVDLVLLERRIPSVKNAEAPDV